ncbi:hypothetical protein [Prochlorococcus sp. MIT 1341]|uniref:hypothetical protein n=1 Tax=Prochlorococcus sp. MIT 1341 TaxID=3096221 RepID=UPI002A75E20F|nr:hypothetical protein [Prochlorococcus sp. MIT 1341]
MKEPLLPSSFKSKTNNTIERKMNAPNRRRKFRRSSEKSDVLVSAVLSTYLLTHLHHVLQRAEFGAEKEGRKSQAKNFAQLRKVLCMDARSMKDASALGLEDSELDPRITPQNRSDAA